MAAPPMNYIVSYDINRPSPKHREMDQHMRQIPGKVHRILETVWMVHTSWTTDQVFMHCDQVLTNNDSLMVVEAENMKFRNLLTADQTIQQSWNAPDHLDELVRAIMRPAARPTGLSLGSAPPLPGGVFGLRR